MIHRIPLIAACCAVLLPTLCLPARSAEYWLTHPVNPAELYAQMAGNPNLEENATGEPFAWHSSGGGTFVTGYRIWGGTEWLDFAVKYFDFLMERMSVAPDGYIGPVGRNFRHELWSEEQVSDALMVGPMLDFAELVLADPGLTREYGVVANRYVDHARIHVVEKWESRGLWHEVGEYGDYIFGDRFVDPDNPSEWVDRPGEGSGGMSQKFNIANKLGVLQLKLYRITGDPHYRDKAEKLFYRLKSNFQRIGEGVTWHYWVPFYRGDLFPEENRLIHWSAVHPFRPGYQSAEVSQIVEAYHTGVVFSEEDIRRLLHTNLEIMWNEDLENPGFINSNGRRPEATEAARRFQQSHSGSGQADRGTLWTALADFDPTVRALYERQLENPRNLRETVRAAWYHTHVKPKPPSFERRYAGNLPVIEKDVPLGNSRELTLATVIPHIIERGTDSILLAKASVPGSVRIDLYSRFGDRRLATLHEGPIAGDPDGQKGLKMVPWDGTDPDGQARYEGVYRIRWTFIDGYRDYEVRVVPPVSGISQ